MAMVMVLVVVVVVVAVVVVKPANSKIKSWHKNVNNTIKSDIWSCECLSTFDK